MDGYDQNYCVYNILHFESEFVAVDVLNDICLSQVNLLEQEVAFISNMKLTFQELCS
jgi:aminoglycoside phosphotransferase family enzyme